MRVQLQLPTDFLRVMVADFARQSPDQPAPLAEGAYVTRLVEGALFVGRTDAGRPQLPRPQEVL